MNDSQYFYLSLMRNAMSKPSKDESDDLGDSMRNNNLLKTSTSEIFDFSPNFPMVPTTKDPYTVSDVDYSGLLMKRRQRILFTQAQIKELEKIFLKKNYLTSYEREKLARAVKLTTTQVKIWFQNRRYKYKKSVIPTPPRYDNTTVQEEDLTSKRKWQALKVENSKSSQVRNRKIDLDNKEVWDRNDPEMDLKECETEGKGLTCNNITAINRHKRRIDWGTETKKIGKESKYRPYHNSDVNDNAPKLPNTPFYKYLSHNTNKNCGSRRNLKFQNLKKYSKRFKEGTNTHKMQVSSNQGSISQYTSRTVPEQQIKNTYGWYPYDMIVNILSNQQNLNGATYQQYPLSYVPATWYFPNFDT